MSKTDKKIRKWLGYKFYKVDENDNVTIIRIIGIEEFNDKVTIINEETKSKKSITIEALKSYTPLKPVGIITFNRVGIHTGNVINKDVIVSLYRLLDIELDMNEPFAICRQNINDFFYNLISNKEDHGWVGVSCTKDNCPTNIPYYMMAACDELYESTAVHWYIDDTLDDVLQCIDTTEFDRILENNYVEHMKSSNITYTKEFDKRECDHGWCRKLSTLLIDNNFISDWDASRNVTALDFNLSEFLIKEDEDVYSLDKASLLYFNHIFQINAVKTMVVEYGYDINMGDFKNSNYTLLRDKTGKTYIVVYNVQGEYLEVDIENELNKLGVGDKIRLDFFNKYHQVK